MKHDQKTVTIANKRGQLLIDGPNIVRLVCGNNQDCYRLTIYNTRAIVLVITYYNITYLDSIVIE